MKFGYIFEQKEIAMLKLEIKMDEGKILAVEDRSKEALRAWPVP